MSLIIDLAKSVYRYFSTDGVPASGPHKPSKADIQALIIAIDGALTGIATASTLAGAYATKSALDADLAHPAGSLAVVYDDSTPANNDFYVKSGASGSGSWGATGIGLPSAFAADLSAINAELASMQAQLDAGLSAYGSWLQLGNVGTVEDFLATLVGDEGPPGPQGPNSPSGTSTTSLAVGTGNKTFTTQTGLQFSVGQPVIIAQTSDPVANRMLGIITAYNSGTGSMTVAVDDSDGSGTHADWTISIGIANAGYAPGGTDVSLADGGTGASLSDPGADRIMFWDDSGSTVAFLRAHTGLTISGTDLLVDNEVIQDMVATLLGTPGTGITVTYDDGGNLIAIAVSQTALKPTESLIIACGDELTAITTGTGKVTFRMPYAFVLTDVRANVKTAPTGAAIIIDINEDGVSILSTKLSIDASEKTSTTAASAAVISDVNLADDAEITIDFDQVGSSVAGVGVKVALIGHRA